MDVGEENVALILRCFQDDGSIDEGAMRLRRGWYDRYRKRGLRARLVASELPTKVTYAEACDPCDRCAITLGPIGGVRIDGEPFAPDAGPRESEALRHETEQRYEAKTR
jgi:methionyl-tRNA synthetase